MIVIFIVDAFTDRPFAGNPAAVAIVNEFPLDETCLKIAAEMNLSETAFVKPLGENRFHIRWFTPKVEMRLCGHATLASAHILYEEKHVNKDEEILFDSLSGQLKVGYSSSNYTLNFPLSEIEEEIEPPYTELNLGGITRAARMDNDLIFELASEELVRKYVPHVEELKKIDCHLIIITAKGTGPYDFISRVFAPSVGVLEDPVTGSAHCRLAHYWRKRLNKSNFVAHQASARGGDIRISIVGDRVHLEGKAVTVLRGQWQVPLS